MVLAPDRIVFCDFDGTITAIETFIGMLNEFTPDLSAVILPQIYARTLTLREGVRQLLESIPSRFYVDIIKYAQVQPIRPGLRELLDFLDEQNVPFVIISGGLEDMIKAVIQREQLGAKISAIAAMSVDASGDYLQVNSAFEDDSELVAKMKVMAQYPATEKIAIGDSVTDINMALAADIVFARDRLIGYMETARKSYIPWQDFLDIQEYLAQKWK